MSGCHDWVPLALYVAAVGVTVIVFLAVALVRMAGDSRE